MTYRGPKKLIPVKYIGIESTSRDGDGHKYFIKTAIEYSDSDYRSFIAYGSDGLTLIGQKTLSREYRVFRVLYSRGTGSLSLEYCQ